MTRPISSWSPEAQRRHESSRATRYRLRRENEAMDRGPYLTRDGMVVIPSYWYNPKAPAIYKRLGMRYHSHNWQRPLAKPHRGKVYGPDAWIRAARKAYSSVWEDWKLPEAGVCRRGGDCRGIGWLPVDESVDGTIQPRYWVPCPYCNPNGQAPTCPYGKCDGSGWVEVPASDVGEPHPPGFATCECNPLADGEPGYPMARVETRSDPTGDTSPIPF
jgi:hypothetical protein